MSGRSLTAEERHHEHPTHPRKSTSWSGRGLGRLGWLLLLLLLLLQKLVLPLQQLLDAPRMFFVLRALLFTLPLGRLLIELLLHVGRDDGLVGLFAGPGSSP